jgi:Helix-turn-helix domain
MATVIQAYRFALDPTPSQRRALASHCGAARVAFNWDLELVNLRLIEHRTDPTTQVPWTLPELRREWNRAKHDVAPWWRENSKEAYSCTPRVQRQRQRGRRGRWHPSPGGPVNRGAAGPEPSCSGGFVTEASPGQPRTCPSAARVETEAANPVPARPRPCPRRQSSPRCATQAHHRTRQTIWHGRSRGPQHCRIGAQPSIGQGPDRCQHGRAAPHAYVQISLVWQSARSRRSLLPVIQDVFGLRMGENQAPPGHAHIYV